MVMYTKVYIDICQFVYSLYHLLRILVKVNQLYGGDLTIGCDSERR